MQENLVFVISAPRSGSTLLQRMLGSHSQVMTHPEPHLITPLAYLGYYDTVDKAPYDHINAAEAVRLFVSGLPRGEDDYLDALRAYADTLYARMLATSGCSRFVDKTPAYALVLPFLTKLYPNARYVVLTRHPLAVFSSYANSFFEGDWAAAHKYNPIVERYVPAIAQLVQTQSVPLVQVAYERLVAEPAEELGRLFDFLGLENEPDAVEYGSQPAPKKGPGDPISVDKHSRPTLASLDRWVEEVRDNPGRQRLAEAMIGRLDSADLEAWGWTRERLFAPLGESSEGIGTGHGGQRLSAYRVQRRVLLALRKNIHTRPHGQFVRRVKYYCDVLLRDTL